jgi:hypothetical protein
MANANFFGLLVLKLLFEKQLFMLIIRVLFVIISAKKIGVMIKEFFLKSNTCNF